MLRVVSWQSTLLCMLHSSRLFLHEFEQSIFSLHHSSSPNDRATLSKHASYHHGISQRQYNAKYNATHVYPQDRPDMQHYALSSSRRLVTSSMCKQLVPFHSHRNSRLSPLASVSLHQLVLDERSSGLSLSLDHRITSSESKMTRFATALSQPVYDKSSASSLSISSESAATITF